MKRKGALLISANDDGTFDLSFHPDIPESFAPETLCDAAVRGSAALAQALTAMGVAGTGPEFVSRIESPPGIFVVLDVMLSKAELRNFGLLERARDPLSIAADEMGEESAGLEAEDV
jgi:hypothetical protein